MSRRSRLREQGCWGRLNLYQYGTSQIQFLVHELFRFLPASAQKSKTPINCVMHVSSSVYPEMSEVLCVWGKEGRAQCRIIRARKSTSPCSSTSKSPASYRQVSAANLIVHLFFGIKLKPKIILSFMNASSSWGCKFTFNSGKYYVSAIKGCWINGRGSIPDKRLLDFFRH
jgi:hypothetical protein